MLIQVRFKDNLVTTAQGGWLMIPETLNTVYDLKKYIVTEFSIHYSPEDLAISHNEFIFTDQVPLEQVLKIAKNLDIVLKHVSNPPPYLSHSPYQYPSFSHYMPGYSDYYHNPYTGYSNPYYPYSYPQIYSQIPNPYQSIPEPQKSILDKDKTKQKKHVNDKSQKYTKIKKKLLKLLPQVYKKRMANIRNSRDQMEIEQKTLPEIENISSSQSNDSSSSEQESYAKSPEIDNLKPAQRKRGQSDESYSNSAERKSSQSDDSYSNPAEEKQIQQTINEIEEERNHSEFREEVRTHPERRSPDYNEPMNFPPTENITRVSVNMKELKRNPKPAQFQGKHIKFDSTGNQVEVKNNQAPAQQFATKKSNWKVRSIPQRNPKQLKEGPEKQKVKRFGEYEYDPDAQIKEVYNFNHEDFVEGDVNSLKPGDEILFKTFELSEERLTPQLSSYKRGRVDWTDEKFVHILLLREYRDEEWQLLEQMEFIDDLVMEKYELTLEKYLLIDLKVKKTHEQTA